jgi:hypothetical protein
MPSYSKLPTEFRRSAAKQRVMATEAEKQAGHKVIAWLFDLPVRDMGGGLKIVTPAPTWISVEERDVIVKAVHDFLR